MWKLLKRVSYLWEISISDLTSVMHPRDPPMTIFSLTDSLTNISLNISLLRFSRIILKLFSPTLPELLKDESTVKVGCSSFSVQGLGLYFLIMWRKLVLSSWYSQGCWSGYCYILGVQAQVVLIFGVLVGLFLPSFMNVFGFLKLVYVTVPGSYFGQRQQEGISTFLSRQLLVCWLPCVGLMIILFISKASYQIYRIRIISQALPSN